MEARLRKVSWGTLPKAAGESMVPYHERHLFRCGKSRAIACCSNLNSFTLSSSRWQVLRGHPGSLALRKKALLSSTNAPGKTKMGAWDRPSLAILSFTIQKMSSMTLSPLKARGTRSFNSNSLPWSGRPAKVFVWAKKQSHRNSKPNPGWTYKT